MNNSLVQEKLRNLDGHYVHPSLALEHKLLKEIEYGYLEEALETQRIIFENEHATMGKDRLHSQKNGLIASCTLFTRAAIAGGIIPEDAFNLSDIFITKIDSADHTKFLEGFEYDMIKSFVKLVQQAKFYNYAYPISKIVKYIYINATKKMTTASIAQFCNLSPDYLSRLFHQEVGMTLTEFIQHQKIEVAKHFLTFSNMSITEIATLLEYCNPAYFSNSFKKVTGMSPVTYKKKYGQVI